MKALVLFVMGCLSCAVMADDITLPQATPAELHKLLPVCQQMAQEDEVVKAELNDYLLECINDQLTEMGYQRIDALPKDQ